MRLDAREVHGPEPWEAEDDEPTEQYSAAEAAVLLGELRREITGEGTGHDDETFSLDAPPLCELGVQQAMPLPDEVDDPLRHAVVAALVLVASLLGVLAGLAVG